MQRLPLFQFAVNQNFLCLEMFHFDSQMRVSLANGLFILRRIPNSC